MREKRPMSPFQEQIQQSQKTWAPLAWWYRISAPSAKVVAKQYTIIQRGELASILILLSLIVTIAFLPAALTSTNMHVMAPIIVLLIATFIAILLNKRGNVILVGILFVIAIDFALIYSLISYPGFMLTQNALPIYDLFVLSDLIAVSLLPTRSILYVSTIHCIFMCADIVLQPHTPDLQQLLNETNYSLMVRPLTLQIVVALITYLWVRNTIKAVERARQAEVVAQLERTIAQQKKDLDEGIQLLLQTLVQAANGDLRVRAPMIHENMLWQVASALNMLLVRLQRAQQNEQELQMIKLELRRLLQSIHESKRKQTALNLMPGGTDLDVIYNEILGHRLITTRTDIPHR